MNGIRCLLLGLLLLTGTALHAQTLTGTVIDALTEQPVPYASIAVYSARDSSVAGGALAETDGTFSVTDLGRGRFWCTVSFIGYATWTSEPFGFGPDPAARKALGTIVLEPSIQALDAAEVVTEQSSMEMLIDRRVFHVGSDLTSTGASAAELLTRVPSVDVDLDGNVSLRGSSNVQILIDGRPSGLSGPAGQAFLAQIPSQTIDRVEIITNPSARFDPDGMAGILNIVLKKNKLAGFNGTVQATPATSGNASAAASLNYRNERLNVFSSLSFNHNDLFSSGSIDRTQTLNDSVQTLVQVRDGLDLGNSLGGRLGFEWTAEQGGQWGLSTNFNSSRETDRETLSNALTWGSAAAATERFVDEANLDAGWDVDGSYRRQFNETGTHKLETSLRLSSNQSEQEQHLTDTWVNRADTSVMDYNNNSSRFDRQVLAVDYTRPLAEDGRLELGWKSTLSDQLSHFDYLDADSTVFDEGIYVPYGVTAVAYDFRYQEDVHAVYGTYGRDWGAWGAQFGSRLEQAFTTAELGNPGSTPFTNDYFSWYPSASLSYESDDRTTWSASYSRRVNRPRGRQVNPFVDDSDPFNIRSGNPSLRPEYTHSFEINRLWTKDRWSISAALFHKRTTDVIRHYSTVDANGVRFSTYANLASRHDEGLEVILSMPLWKASSLRLTGDVYHLANDAGDLEAATNAQGWTHNLSLYANLAFGAHWKGQINGRYRGPSITPQGRFNGMSSLDLALQRSFLDQRLSFSLRVSDLFNTRQWSYLNDIPTSQFYQEVVHKRESRNVFVDLRWSFGKLEEGGRRNRGGGFDGGAGGFDGGGDF